MGCPGRFLKCRPKSAHCGHWMGTASYRDATRQSPSPPSRFYWGRRRPIALRNAFPGASHKRNLERRRRRRATLRPSVERALCRGSNPHCVAHKGNASRPAFQPKAFKRYCLPAGQSFTCRHSRAGATASRRLMSAFDPKQTLALVHERPKPALKFLAVPIPSLAPEVSYTGLLCEE